MVSSKSPLPTTAWSRSPSAAVHVGAEAARVAPPEAVPSKTCATWASAHRAMRTGIASRRACLVSPKSAIRSRPSPTNTTPTSTAQLSRPASVTVVTSPPVAASMGRATSMR